MQCDSVATSYNGSGVSSKQYCGLERVVQHPEDPAEFCEALKQNDAVFQRSIEDNQHVAVHGFDFVPVSEPVERLDLICGDK